MRFTIRDVLIQRKIWIMALCLHIFPPLSFSDHISFCDRVYAFYFIYFLSFCSFISLFIHCQNRTASVCFVQLQQFDFTIFVHFVILQKRSRGMQPIHGSHVPASLSHISDAKSYERPASSPQTPYNTETRIPSVSPPPYQNHMRYALAYGRLPQR